MKTPQETKPFRANIVLGADGWHREAAATPPPRPAPTRSVKTLPPKQWRK